MTVYILSSYARAYEMLKKINKNIHVFIFTHIWIRFFENISNSQFIYLYTGTNAEIMIIKNSNSLSLKFNLGNLIFAT